MPDFDSEFTPDTPLRILTAMMGNKGGPHALLFTGIEGSGKFEAARRLAMTLNCQSLRETVVGSGRHLSTQKPPPALTPCGACRSCRKIRSDTHPDILIVKPAGVFIKIDAVRELCRTLGMKPYEAAVRVVIICDAQAMNPSAANALLKVLEEPPERTVFVLTADHAAGLLPTVVSRCQQVRFHPLPAERLAKRLMEERGVSKEEALALAIMANGSLSRALSLHRAGWVQRRSWLLGQLAHLPRLRPGVVMAIASRLSKNREFFERYLEIIYTWIRDTAVCLSAPQEVIYRDVVADLQTAAAGRSTASILEQADMVSSAMQHLRNNANPRLTAEVLLLKLADTARLPYDSGERLS